MTKVLIFGTFDVLHEGHRYFFRKAKEFGDELFVVVARDSTVKENKGVVLHHDEQERLQNVENDPYVDKAVLGSEGYKMKVIDDIKPDIVCLGYDQVFFIEDLREYVRGKDIEIKTIDSYKPDQYKSTIIRSLS